MWINADILKGPDSTTQYRDLQPLNQGGMGQIYTATDTVNNLTVAVKLIQVSSSEEKVLLEREFKIAYALSHPNIVTTFYYNNFEHNSRQYFYSVMEYQAAGSLKEFLGKSTTILPLGQCITFFRDLLNGLQEAHKTIIHRDLKPQNILLGTDDRLKICDFGIAKYADILTNTHTHKGWGSSLYMAPECWEFETNTAQMDIYSMGIIFYEILALRPPYIGESEMELRNQHLYAPLPQITQFRSDVSFNLMGIIRKMTKKRPSDRFKNIGEILNAIEALTITENPSRSNIQSVLQSAHQKLIKKSELEMKLDQEQREDTKNTQLLLSSISQVFDQFSDVAEDVNRSLYDEKIIYSRAHMDNPYAAIFKLRFFNGSLTVSFFNQNIHKYLEWRREQHWEYQKRHYGFNLQEYIPDYIERDNVLLIGKAELSSANNGQHAGFNLVLRREGAEDLYGNWWICKFSPMQRFSNVSVNFFHPINVPDFFEEYNYGRGNVAHVRNMTFSLLQEQDITELFTLMTQL